MLINQYIAKILLQWTGARSNGPRGSFCQTCGRPLDRGALQPRHNRCLHASGLRCLEDVSLESISDRESHHISFRVRSSDPYGPSESVAFCSRGILHCGNRHCTTTT